MPGIFGGIALSGEDMSQMAAAFPAEDFHPVPVGVWSFSDGSGNFLVKAGPAATGVEFGGGCVKRRVAFATLVRSFDKKIVVLASTGRFGAFVFDNAFFFGG